MWPFRPKRAKKYTPCRLCKGRKYSPRGRGDIVERWGMYYVRQFFVCENCGVRHLLWRRVDRTKWVHSLLEA